MVWVYNRNKLIQIIINNIILKHWENIINLLLHYLLGAYNTISVDEISV